MMKTWRRRRTHSHSFRVAGGEEKKKRCTGGGGQQVLLSGAVKTTSTTAYCVCLVFGHCVVADVNVDVQATLPLLWHYTNCRQTIGDRREKGGMGARGVDSVSIGRGRTKRARIRRALFPNDVTSLYVRLHIQCIIRLVTKRRITFNENKTQWRAQDRNHRPSSW